MNDKYLIGLINDLLKESDHNKDDGTELVKKLAYFFSKTDDSEKTIWVRFFLNEIEFNVNNGFWSICLDAFVEANYTTIAPEIERIFVEQKKQKDNFWKFRFTRALLLLNCKSLSYIGYIDDLINKKDGAGYILLIYLSSVNPDLALVKLSEFYNDYLSNWNNKSGRLVKDRMDLLFKYISKNGSNYVINLVKRTYDKNKKQGLILKKIFIDFLKSEIKYDKSFKDKIISELFVLS